MGAAKDRALTDLQAPNLSTDYYKAYEEHSKVLRTWLVAYGIGAPVLFLTNETLAAKLAGSAVAGRVAALFLVGVAAQVLLAAFNKTVMWVIRPLTNPGPSITRPPQPSEKHDHRRDDEIDLPRTHRFFAPFRFFGLAPSHSTGALS